MPVQTKPDFLHLLRAHTSSYHSALETLPLSKKLTSENLSVNDYVQYLSLMREIISSVEQKIFPLVSHIITDINERKKLQLIEDDLKTFNVSFNTQSYHECNMINEAKAMGIMYVIEGSTLGGRMILKNVKQTLKFSELGVSFFSGYGDSTSEKWKKFLGILIGYEERTGSTKDIIAGANAAFKNIYNFMNNNTFE